MADFQNGLISGIFSVFLERFLEQNNSKSFVEFILTSLFEILIFDPKWGFCKACSFCMMTDLPNGLISGILSVFWIGFFAQNNSKWCVDWILTCFFFNFNYWPKVRILQSDGRFSKWSLFWNIWCNWSVFFCTEQLQMICRKDFDMAFGILIFDPKGGFYIAYSLCMMADFQNRYFLEYLVQLERFFTQNNSKWFVERILTWLLEF